MRNRQRFIQSCLCETSPLLHRFQALRARPNPCKSTYLAGWHGRAGGASCQSQWAPLKRLIKSPHQPSPQKGLCRKIGRGHFFCRAAPPAPFQYLLPAWGASAKHNKQTKTPDFRHGERQHRFQVYPAPFSLSATPQSAAASH